MPIILIFHKPSALLVKYRQKNLGLGVGGNMNLCQFKNMESYALRDSKNQSRRNSLRNNERLYTSPQKSEDLNVVIMPS